MDSSLTYWLVHINYPYCSCSCCFSCHRLLWWSDQIFHPPFLHHRSLDFSCSAYWQPLCWYCLSFPKWAASEATLQFAEVPFDRGALRVVQASQQTPWWTDADSSFASGCSTWRPLSSFHKRPRSIAFWVIGVKPATFHRQRHHSRRLSWQLSVVFLAQKNYYLSNSPLSPFDHDCCSIGSSLSCQCSH